MLMATASSSAVHQYLCAYSGAALSEFFVITGELPSLLILDDLSRHACAYRENSIFLYKPVCNASVTDCLSIIPGAGDSMAQGYCILILPELKIRLPTGSRMEAIVQSPRMMVASELNAWTVEP